MFFLKTKPLKLYHALVCTNKIEKNQTKAMPFQVTNIVILTIKIRHSQRRLERENTKKIPVTQDFQYRNILDTSQHNSTFKLLVISIST